MITVAFCGHLPLRRCRSADVVISAGGFPSAACTVLHAHAIYRRMVAVLFFCGGFWLVLRVLCELLRERLRFGDFPCFSPVASQNCFPYFFRRFRYCPVYAALRSDGRQYRRRRHEFASAAASSLHCFIAE